MFTATAVVALVLVDVAKAEDDAGLGHKIRCTRCGEVHLLRTVFSHSDDVVHNGGHVGSTCTVMPAVLIDMAVGEENSAETAVYRGRHQGSQGDV